VDSDKDADERHYVTSGFLTLQLTVDRMLAALAGWRASHPDDNTCPLTSTGSGLVIPDIEVGLITTYPDSTINLVYR
jgi:hypothetical protein